MTPFCRSIISCGGTIAEEAELIYHALPIICKCNQCQENFVFHLKYGERTECCPVCGSDRFELITGNELLVRHIEICQIRQEKKSRT